MGDDGATHAKEVSFSKRHEVMGDWNLGVYCRSQKKTVAQSAYTTLNIVHACTTWFSQI